MCLRNRLTWSLSPDLGGELGILPGHTPLISQLQTGVLTYVQDGKNYPLHVSGGFVEVRDDHVSVLAEVAERPDEIDAARAKLSRERLEKQLNAWTWNGRGFRSSPGEAGALGGASTISFYVALGFIAAFISLTAVSSPTKIARAMMLWPILNSVISLIRANCANIPISQSMTRGNIQSFSQSELRAFAQPL